MPAPRYMLAQAAGHSMAAAMPRWPPPHYYYASHYATLLG